MAVFSTPESHADNSPSTWTVVKAGDRLWHLRTEGGTTLDSFKTKRDALEAIESGWLRKAYDQEGRWYAGHTPHGMRSWAECKAEREAIEARRAARALANA